MPELLRIDALTLRVDGTPIVSDVDLHVDRGECVALVGESGSGKSMTAKAILAIQPARVVVEGHLFVDGIDVITAGEAAIRRIRQRTAAMIYQNPRPGINPLRRVGAYIVEGVVHAGLMTRMDARTKAVELLRAVGLPKAEQLFYRYPFELSGGMLQRVMIVGALMSDPQLMLCDEPTTALDVTTQAEVIAILAELQRSRGLGMLFITHDLDLAAAISARTYVMYRGEIVETGDSQALLDHPTHPYTEALIQARPVLEGEPGQRLVTVAERMAAIGTKETAA